MALPGISFEIVRTAGPVLGIRTDRGGLLALTERGPEETPTLVHSPAQFRQVFGCPLDGMLGALAAQAFFKNGGQELVVGRFLPDEASAATGQLPVVPASGPPTPFLALLARERGAFGNRINVDSTIFVRKRLRGACTVTLPTTTLSFTGLTKAFDASDLRLPVRLLSTGQDVWSRIKIVGPFSAGNQTLTLETNPLLSSLPDLIVEEYERTFSLRIREPNRDDVVIGGLDTTKMTLANELLASSAIRINTPTTMNPELPGPSFVVRLSGGSDGLAVGGSPVELENSFRRTLLAMEESALPDISFAPDLWSRIYATKGIERLAFSAPRAIALADEMMASAERTRDRIVIVDPPLGGPGQLLPYGPSELEAWRAARATVTARQFSTMYTPWPLIVAGPVFKGNDTLLVPPSAFVAGQIARTTRDRGPWVATGNVALEGLVALDQALTRDQEEELQDIGINPLRVVLPQGMTIQGVRSLAWPDYKPWRFISTRQLFNFLRKALTPIGLSYTFEPNSPETWIQLRRDIERLLRDLFSAGALAGSRAEEGFFVRIDESLNPEDARDNGILTARVGLAPALPLEFLVVRLELQRGIANVVEEPIAL